MWPPAPGLEPGSHHRLSVEFRRFYPLGHGEDFFDKILEFEVLRLKNMRKLREKQRKSLQFVPKT